MGFLNFPSQAADNCTDEGEYEAKNDSIGMHCRKISTTKEIMNVLCKNWNPTTEGDLEFNYNPYEISCLQKYNPIYSTLFPEIINETNCNDFSLEHLYYFTNMDEVYCEKTREHISKPIFIKYSPILDPIRFMIGKYDMSMFQKSLDSNETLVFPSQVTENWDSGESLKQRKIPQFNFPSQATENWSSPSLRFGESLNLFSSSPSDPDCENILSKINNAYNASYVDSFFCFLSGKLLQDYNLKNCVDYYGSFNGVQKQFKINIADDFDYLKSSKKFKTNLGKYFNLEKKCFDCNLYKENIVKYSHDKRAKINIANDVVIENIDDMIENLASPEQIESESNFGGGTIDEGFPSQATEKYKSIPLLKNVDNEECEDKCLIYENTLSQHSSSGSSCSSHTTVSMDDMSEEDNASVDSIETDENDSEGSEEDDEQLYAYINDFPVQMICMEKCKGTFDELLMRNELTDKECESAIFQIVITLTIFQKLFNFTHNDLHTNNIVYVETEEEYLYYKFEQNIYKVPTYGKIYKIIDFGRSIYTVNGILFCSDSFGENGDASTQYNFPINSLGRSPEKMDFEPFYNKDKPIIEPNYSFDLSRLGCSIYDFVFDDFDYSHDDPLFFKKASKFQKLIYEWCTDDKGKNILYKKNGDERYPQFKLYKMIARNVHNCVPREQFTKPIFQQFVLNKKKSKKMNLENKEIMDIDEISLNFT
jgi:hypothetical protein